MNSLRLHGWCGVALALWLSYASQAAAADILVVLNTNQDAGLAVALRADGHTVTLVTEDAQATTTAIAGDLSRYDAIYWSATGRNERSAEQVRTLESYVRAGGRLLVTGADAPHQFYRVDPSLLFLLGAFDSVDFTGPATRISERESSLTVGVVDIRGQNVFRQAVGCDGLLNLGADTREVVGSIGGEGIGSIGSQWTIRRLGQGEVAFVCNGNEFGSLGPSWLITENGPTGVYNAAIRNFAAASELPVPPEAPDAGPAASDGGVTADAGPAAPNGGVDAGPPRTGDASIDDEDCTGGCQAAGGGASFPAFVIVPALAWIVRRARRRR